MRVKPISEEVTERLNRGRATPRMAFKPSSPRKIMVEEPEIINRTRVIPETVKASHTIPQSRHTQSGMITPVTALKPLTTRPFEKGSSLKASKRNLRYTESNGSIAGFDFN